MQYRCPVDFKKIRLERLRQHILHDLYQGAAEQKFAVVIGRFDADVVFGGFHFQHVFPVYFVQFGANF